MATYFRDALLVQLDPPRVEAGNLRVADGKIVGMGTDVVAVQGDETVDCDGAVLMPGLVNGHTHLYSALAAGMPAPLRPPRNFHEILQFIWWRLDRAHDAGKRRNERRDRCAGRGALRHDNAYRSSCVSERDRRAASRHSRTESPPWGCRGVLCYEVTDRNRPDEAGARLGRERTLYSISANRARCGNFRWLSRCSRKLHDGRRIACAGCVELAQRLKVGIHIHVGRGSGR